MAIPRIKICETFFFMEHIMFDEKKSFANLELANQFYWLSSESYHNLEMSFNENTKLLVIIYLIVRRKIEF